MTFWLAVVDRVVKGQARRGARQWYGRGWGWRGVCRVSPALIVAFVWLWAVFGLVFTGTGLAGAMLTQLCRPAVMILTELSGEPYRNLCHNVDICA